MISFLKVVLQSVLFISRSSLSRLSACDQVGSIAEETYNKIKQIFAGRIVEKLDIVG